MSKRQQGTELDAVTQLEVFRDRVRQLMDCRLVRTEWTNTISWNFSSVEGMRFSAEGPDEDDLRSFLLTFRQFLSQGEPVQLYKIYNLAQQVITSDELKSKLIDSREIWKQAHKRTGMILEWNGKEVTPERVMELWISHYFHSDNMHTRTIFLNIMPHERMLLRHQFLLFIEKAIQQVVYVNNVITIALKEGLVAQ